MSLGGSASSVTALRSNSAPTPFHLLFLQISKDSRHEVIGGKAHAQPCDTVLEISAQSCPKSQVEFLSELRFLGSKTTAESKKVGIFDATLNTTRLSLWLREPSPAEGGQSRQLLTSSQRYFGLAAGPRVRVLIKCGVAPGTRIVGSDRD